MFSNSAVVMSPGLYVVYVLNVVMFPDMVVVTFPGLNVVMFYCLTVVIFTGLTVVMFPDCSESRLQLLQPGVASPLLVCYERTVQYKTLVYSMSHQSQTQFNTVLRYSRAQYITLKEVVV